MDSAEITRQKDGWVESYTVGTKITRQRMENYMVGTEMTLPKGWMTQK